MSVLIVRPTNRKVVVKRPGPPGPTGPHNLFIQPTAPTAQQLGNITTYVWWQTGLGANGNGVTLYIEDGT